MKLLLPFSFLLFICSFTVRAQVCNPNGNIVIFSNYDGGVLNVNVDQNIPNLKIGIVSYEAVEVNFSGTYLNNITAIEYAGYNNSPNQNCAGSIPTTAFSGAPVGVTPVIQTLPPVSYSDPNGYLYMVCAYTCAPGNAGGCNTAPQVYDYFENLFSGTVYSHTTQYGCWQGTTLSLSAGGNCCAAPPPPPTPPTANFTLSNATICAGDCISLTDLSTNQPTAWNWTFNGANTNTSTAQNPSGICYSAPGVYDVTLVAINANGSDTLTQTLTVNSVNTATTLSGLTITASATGAGYQWIDCATNQPINGATAASFTASSNGVYAVIVTENGCTDTSACTTIATVNLEPLATSDLMSIYPNPSKGIFTLLDKYGNLTGEQITVSNVLGEVIYTSVIVDDKTLIDLTAAQNGIYFIHVDGQSGSRVSRIVKE